MMVHKEETYHFLGLHFRVYPLWQYAQKKLEPHRIKLNILAKFYGFNAVESKNSMSMFNLDPKYAMSLISKDYHQPILIVKLGIKSGGLMIDGLHRSYRAWKKGQKTIRAYYIENRNILEKNSNIRRFNLD